MVPKMYCHWCYDLEPTTNQETLEHDLSEFLRHANATDCPYCIILRHGISRCKKAMVIEYNESAEYKVYSVLDRKVGLRVDIWYSSSMLCVLELEFFTTELLWNPVIKQANTLDSTASPECMNWIKERVHHCQTYLAACGKIEETSSSTYLRRVLHLDWDQAHKYDQKIKLLQLENTAMSEPYACLSNCWGDSGPSLQLETRNLSSLQSGIGWAELPRTFQDAIVCYRTLGIHHIWIDSLCIVQDDIRDWEREAKNMADIYEIVPF